MEICFICRYPTTDFSRNESGEPICGSCLSDNSAEHDAVYYSLGQYWEEDMKAMLADHD